MSPRQPLARRVPTRPVLLAAGAVLAAAVSGCGVTDTEFRPGLAAKVDDRTVRLSEVEHTADSLCRVLQSDTRFAGQEVARSQLGNAAARGLAVTALADELVEDHDLELPDDVDHGREQVELAYGIAAEEDVEGAMPAFIGDNYLYDVLLALGDDDSSTLEDDEKSLAAGVEVAARWQEEHDIEVNPAFEQVRLDPEALTGPDGVTQLPVTTSRDDLSVADSEFAQEAQAGEAAWAATLPASQRCTGPR